MSIENEIRRVGNNIDAAYTACGEKGASLPQMQNSANLAETIGGIPQSGTVDAYTRAQTDTLLGGKAAVIVDETELSYDTDLSDYADQDVTVKVQEDTLGHPYLLLSEGENLLPAINSAKPSGTVSGVTIEVVNGTVRLNGTAEAVIKIWLGTGPLNISTALVQGDAVTVGMLHHGTMSGSKINTILRLTDGSNTQLSKSIENSGMYSGAIEAAGACTQMRIYIEIPSGGSYTDYIITPFAFKSSDVDVIDNPVYTGGFCDVSSSVENVDYLSTYPNLHKVIYKADTKTYIDTHVPEIDMDTIEAEINSEVNAAVDTKVTYITPEMYGAKGDGVTDDTQALQTCLSRASSTVCVKALKYYKITEQISVSGNNLNIEINRINYSGENFAVKIATRMSVIRIKQLEAQSGHGILVKNDNAVRIVDVNSFEFDYIKSSGDCIRFVAVDAAYKIAYNNFKVPYLVSTAGNLININKGCEECVFTGGKVDCVSGWCIYDSVCSCTFRDFAFEKTLNICYGTAKIQNCRTAEGLNYYDWKTREGVFMKLTKTPQTRGRMITDENTESTYTGVDVSELKSFSQLLGEINQKIADHDPTDPQIYYTCCYDVINYAPNIIPNISRHNGYGGSQGYPDHTLDGKMVIYWNKKAYVPNHDVYENITTTPFVPMQTLADNPTYFEIGVADCVINLNDSYCPVGIDSFIVEQTNDYKATIYNKDNVLVFDGQNQPAGKYKVQCITTPVPDDVFSGINMPAARQASYAQRIRNVYLGTNEAWSVTPIVNA